MAPILCPSPDLIDHSFPRSLPELQKVAGALARVIEGLNDGEFTFLLTEPLRSIIQNAEYTFDWSKAAEFRGLKEVYDALIGLGLQQFGVETIELAAITVHNVHPVPSGCLNCADTEMWADEIGRLHFVHESCRDPQKPPFVGIGCTSAFSGSALGSYENPEGVPALPLVGPTELAGLSDAEAWDVADEWSRRTVSFREARVNLRLLGAKCALPQAPRIIK